MDSNHRNVRVKVWCLTTWLRDINVVEGHGFEPWNPKEQIYSLPRLTTSLTLQISGANCRNRTRNLLITSQLRYQLRQVGIKWWAIQDSNLWPPACKAGALTNWANRPKNGAQGRTWTGTGFNTRRILSPVRLPVPPLGQHQFGCLIYKTSLIYIKTLGKSTFFLDFTKSFKAFIKKPTLVDNQ